MMNTFDFVILGGGCIGSSIAYQLTDNGLQSVALIDHSFKTQSATLFSGGMIRVFHESLQHTKLAYQSYLSFTSFIKEGILKESLSRHGSLYFFDPSRRDSYAPILSYLSEQQYPFEILTSEQGQKRFPEYVWENRSAIYEPLGMQISPFEYVEEMRHGGSQRGLTLFTEHEVTRICQSQGGYRLLGHGINICAKNLILAGGAQMMSLIQNLKLGLSLEAKPLSYFKIKTTGSRKVLPNYFDRETLEFGGGFANEDIILSHLQPTRFQEPFEFQNYQICEALDSYAPLRAGYMGNVAGFPNLIVATGWGGTAFKFAPEVAVQITKLLKKNQVARGMSYG